MKQFKFKIRAPDAPDWSSHEGLGRQIEGSFESFFDSRASRVATDDGLDEDQGTRTTDDSSSRPQLATRESHEIEFPAANEDEPKANANGSMGWGNGSG